MFNPRVSDKDAIKDAFISLPQPISSEPSIHSLNPLHTTLRGTQPPYAHWYSLLEQVIGRLVVSLKSSRRN